MARFWGGLALALGLALATPARADEIDGFLGRMLSQPELHAAHPDFARSETYHDLGHSLTVPRAAFELAAARKLPQHEREFLAQVGLVHDLDPDRTPGTPARVDATLALLEADWKGTRPLAKGATGSVLKQRFGWTPTQYKTARALILRTQYPFDPKAAIRYERALNELPATQRKFTLREGALLSEFADKGSLYMTAGFMRVSTGTVGLAGEITRGNAERGAPGVTVAGLHPDRFLQTIGDHDYAQHDRAIAKRLRLDVAFLSRDDVFALKPQWKQTFRSNLHGYQAMLSALKRTGSMDAARAAGVRASRSVLNGPPRGSPASRPPTDTRARSWRSSTATPRTPRRP